MGIDTRRVVKFHSERSGAGNTDMPFGALVAVFLAQLGGDRMW